MFDDLVETTISGGGKVMVKRYVADERTAAEIDTKAERRDIIEVMKDEALR